MPCHTLPVVPHAADQLWPYAIGYVISILGGHLAILAVDGGELHQLAVRHASVRKTEANARDRLVLPPALGIVERGLYTAALLAGVGAFVAAWLGLKAIGLVRERTADYVLYHRFLILSGISLGAAATGWQAVDWLRTPGDRQWTFAAGSVAGLFAGCLALRSYIDRRITRPARGLTSLNPASQPDGLRATVAPSRRSQDGIAARCQESD